MLGRCGGGFTTPSIFFDRCGVGPPFPATLFYRSALRPEKKVSGRPHAWGALLGDHQVEEAAFYEDRLFDGLAIGELADAWVLQGKFLDAGFAFFGGDE